MAKNNAASLKRYYQKNKIELNAKRTEWNRKLKLRFMEMYGGAQCECCGETHFEFLTIEHRLGQKTVTREKGSTAYYNAVRSYRPDLYGVLCMNCNFSKGKFGYCPHQNREQVTIEANMRADS